MIFLILVDEISSKVVGAVKMRPKGEFFNSSAVVVQRSRQVAFSSSGRLDVLAIGTEPGRLAMTKWHNSNSSCQRYQRGSLIKASAPMMKHSATRLFPSYFVWYFCRISCNDSTL